MAEIRRVWLWRHLRSDSAAHILFDRAGRRAASGKGLAFWFLPLSASIAEIPMDDRDLPLAFSGRTRDFQEVSVQGVVTWRVADPEVVAGRVDFSLDLDTGKWARQPLEAVAQRVVELAQQEAAAWIAGASLADALGTGVEAVRGRVAARLAEELPAFGLVLVSVRVAAVRPTAEVERALQTPARESLQQEADKATYARRALAVDRERAIAENELANKIELARREEELIRRKGQNERGRVTEEAAAAQIQAEAQAQRQRLQSATEADAIRAVEAARAEAEGARVAIYRELPPHVQLGLALQQLAQHLPAIQHLSLTPDLFGPALQQIADGLRREA